MLLCILSVWIVVIIIIVFGLMLVVWVLIFKNFLVFKLVLNLVFVII